MAPYTLVMGTTKTLQKLFAFFGLLVVIAAPLSMLGFISGWVMFALVAACALAATLIVVTTDEGID